MENGLSLSLPFVLLFSSTVVKSLPKRGKRDTITRNSFEQGSSRISGSISPTRKIHRISSRISIPSFRIYIYIYTVVVSLKENSVLVARIRVGRAIPGSSGEERRRAFIPVRRRTDSLKNCQQLPCFLPSFLPSYSPSSLSPF